MFVSATLDLYRTHGSTDFMTDFHLSSMTLSLLYLGSSCGSVTHQHSIVSLVILRPALDLHPDHSSLNVC